MAGIEDKLRNVRTLEDIVSILSILFNNMNSLSRNYYDLFVNPTPMTIPMKLYDDNGDLITKDIPNIASYRTSVIVSNGAPEGTVDGDIGALCINTANSSLYFKASNAEPSRGWIEIYDINDNLLSKNGNGRNLTDLDTDQLVSGVLPIARGGTASAGGWEGLVYSNGLQYRKAIEGEDYAAPYSSVGIVSYFYGVKNIDGSDISFTAIREGTLVEINNNYVVCNGATLSGDPKYDRLKAVLGGSTLPNLLNAYLKGSSEVGSTIVEGTVGSHSHGLSGSTSTVSNHTHQKGTMEITGGFSGSGGSADQGLTDSGGAGAWGAFYRSTKKAKRVKVYNEGADPDNYYDFAASRTWTGETEPKGAHSHSLNAQVLPNADSNIKNDVRHMDAIPVIKF